MTTLVAALALGALAAPPDVLMLPIGREGSVEVSLGKMVDTRTGKEATVESFAAAADGKRWVYLGEEHATGTHQALMAEVVDALVKRGRRVVVGVEFFTRPVQPALDKWSRGELEEAAFLEEAEWTTQWGFDYALYRPIFESVRANKLPLVALNVPRAWVRQTGREGFEALSAEIRAQLPENPDFGVEGHRKLFDALMGGHPTGGTSGNRIYQAQVLWDVAMADTAIKWLAANPAPEGTADDKTVFVVMAGWGHLGYGVGINHRVRERTGQEGLTLVMATGEGSRPVSRGLADFVYLAPKKN